ncbi:MAG: hypothetical protein Q4A82_02595 [Corynebacterium sp.]|nr:hypothetical protein [Corynebacterium sp.]
MNDYYDVVKLDSVRQTKQDLSGLKVNMPENYYIYDNSEDDQSRHCFAGVLTKRGRLEFDYTSPFIDNTTTGKEKVCQTAVDSLQKY